MPYEPSAAGTAASASNRDTSGRESLSVIVAGFEAREAGVVIAVFEAREVGVVIAVTHRRTRTMAALEALPVLG